MSLAELKRALRKHWIPAVLVIAVLAVITLCILLGPEMTEENMRGMLRRYGYGIILVWTFLEGETIVILAGMWAASLGLNPWLIALYAFLGSFTSDQLMFSLGRYKGGSVLQWFPRIAKNMDKAAVLFKKYDIALILGFRFVYGVRNVTPVLLGISGVSHFKFFALNIIGAGIWALSFAFGGHYSGEAFMHLKEQVGHNIFYVLIAIGVVAFGVWFLRSRRTISNARQVAEQGLQHPIASSKRRPPDNKDGSA
jgi:membrane protein DedA with SNARE-associated domain